MSYQPINFSLNDNQIKKIRTAKAKKMPVTVTISKGQINSGEHTLYLTKSQYKRLSNMKSNRH